MASQELTEQVLEVTAAAYGVDVAELSPETSFDELGGGSMKMIALTSTLENELDVEITIHEIMKMKSLQELIERVEDEL
ncbi:acyl carrier protein [Collinsella sp. zg1085]|uniref:acyl carrier protein n=1 Tax=Collinsella sp. zg1085 TaxID=2844380 RepID=UPI001C0B0809|nr:acyl carrier protein [Collinsella sp. zg1085]QWT17163.1 acyl carrier protein [Collinsella sp. zg1085]